MFLTRAELRRDSATISAVNSILRKQARDDGGHAVVWTLFSDESKRARDFIWRETADGYYYILGKDVPKNETGLWHIESKPFAPHFAPGDRLRFSLRANPTIATKAERNKNGRGKIVDVVMHAKTLCGDRSNFSAADTAAAALDWLCARGEKWGVEFEEDHCQLLAYAPDHKGRKDGAPISVSVADFEGTLTVADPALFLAHLMSGFGRAKSYGCGLMLVRPV
jgi:CRISPR system Cascade subunit CasE